MRKALPPSAIAYSRRSASRIVTPLFLIAVMRDAGVFLGRQYAAFAGCRRGKG
jgi:hypothetical protein